MLTTDTKSSGLSKIVEAPEKSATASIAQQYAQKLAERIAEGEKELAEKNETGNLICQWYSEDGKLVRRWVISD